MIALNKGLHVFCEKPLGTNLNECLKIKKLVNSQKDLIFMLGFMRRYDPSYIYLKKKVDEGIIGTPILFRGYSVDPESLISNAISVAIRLSNVLERHSEFCVLDIPVFYKAYTW